MKPPRSTRGPGAQPLISLWVAGLVLFNFPMLIIFDSDATLLGLPLLTAALFAIWALLIAALAWLMEHGGDDDRDGGDASVVPRLSAPIRDTPPDGPESR